MNNNRSILSLAVFCFVSFKYKKEQTNINTDIWKSIPYLQANPY